MQYAFLISRARDLFIRSTLLAALVSLAASAAAQEPSMPQATPQGSPPAATAPQDSTDEFRDLAPAKISSGDLLEVQVYGVPELTQKSRINRSGEIYLPLIGSVHLAGLSVNEAQALIEKRYVDGNFMTDPHVNIFVTESALGVYLLGEVVKPGVYPLIGSPLLIDVITEAGGLSPAAGKVVTITHRENPEQPETVVLSDDPIKGAASNVTIRQGDRIQVKKAGIVYVVGEVVQPGGFVIQNDESLTVLQAVAMARGATRAASLKGIVVVRKTATGLQQIPVALNKVMESKATDLSLQHDDIVYVPNSVAKNVAKRSAESILAVATSLAIYRP